MKATTRGETATDVVRRALDPDSAIVSHAQIAALCRLLQDDGHMTPIATRIDHEARGCRHLTPNCPEVGTGAGGGDDRAKAEATSWVNGSMDCPEAPAQAHL